MNEIAFTKLVDEAMKIRAEGVEKFYEQFNPDPWSAAVIEVETLLTPDMSDKTQRAALALLKAKRQKMVDLYRDFLHMQDKEWQSQAKEQAEAEFEVAEQDRRFSIRCDSCRGNLIGSAQIRLKLVEQHRQDDGALFRIVISQCLACAQKEKQA